MEPSARKPGPGPASRAPRAAVRSAKWLAVAGLALGVSAACSENSEPSSRSENGGSGGSSGATATGGSSGTSGSSAGGNAGTTSGSAGASAGSESGGSGATGGTSGGSAGAAGAGGSAGSGETAGSSGAGGSGGAGASGGAGSGGKGGSAGGGGTSGNGTDVFGIRRIYPSAASGAEWTSAHWDGEPYDITGRTDPNDPLQVSGLRGTGTLEVTGTGELVMGGSQPRIYVYPTELGPWKDLEITAYYQRVTDAGTAYAGLVIGARSGDGHNDSTACEAHTYYARVRNDGAFDFEKELKHPASSTQSRIAPATAWPPNGEVPRNTWIGFKFVIYNLATPGQVKLEAYRDLTNGMDGGTWTLVNETIDDGGWSVETDCAAHSPSGGQSDLVVVDGGTTFIRNTDVTEARYRWVTVREIDPP